MTGRTTIKIIVDIGMTIALLLLEAYSLVGKKQHEYIGVTMSALFLLHHFLNRAWSRNIFRGKYTSFRVWQSILVLLILACMVSSMVSGIVLSKYVFRSLPVHGGKSVARTVHMLAGNWGFVLMGLHLGIHWNMIRRMAEKKIPVKPPVKKVLRYIPAAIALYGVFAMVRRGIPGYLFMRTRFAFFDFEEPLVFFFLDYIAVMVLFVWIGDLTASRLKNKNKK